MADCTPQSLLDDAKCLGLACIPPGQQVQVALALLYRWSGTTMTTQELLTFGRCFNVGCVPEGQMRQIALGLLCRISGGGTAQAPAPGFFSFIGGELPNPYNVDPNTLTYVGVAYVPYGSPPSTYGISYKQFTVGAPAEAPTPGSHGWSAYDIQNPGISIFVDLSGGNPGVEVRAVGIEDGFSMSDVAVLTVLPI